MMFDVNGAYKSRKPSFKSAKGIFTLVGSESNEDEDTWEQKKESWRNRNIGSTIDTFLHKESGQYFPWSRKQIAKWEDDGMLTSLQL